MTEVNFSTLLGNSLSLSDADNGQIIKVGDKVRVKPSVKKPTYKWGSVTHASIGTVTGEKHKGVFCILVYTYVYKEDSIIFFRVYWIFIDIYEESQWFP